MLSLFGASGRPRSKHQPEGLTANQSIAENRIVEIYGLVAKYRSRYLRPGFSKLIFAVESVSWLEVFIDKISVNTVRGSALHGAYVSRWPVYAAGSTQVRFNGRECLCAAAGPILGARF